MNSVCIESIVVMHTIFLLFALFILVIKIQLKKNMHTSIIRSLKL